MNLNTIINTKCPLFRHYILLDLIPMFSIIQKIPTSFRVVVSLIKLELVTVLEGDEHLWRTNLQAFLEMLTMTDALSLQMRAVILRYFGNFDEAIDVLQSIRFPRDPHVIDFLIDQCKQGNRMVVEIE